MQDPLGWGALLHAPSRRVRWHGQPSGLGLIGQFIDTRDFGRMLDLETGTILDISRQFCTLKKAFADFVIAMYRPYRQHKRPPCPTLRSTDAMINSDYLSMLPNHMQTCKAQ